VRDSDIGTVHILTKNLHKKVFELNIICKKILNFTIKKAMTQKCCTQKKVVDSNTYNKKIFIIFFAHVWHKIQFSELHKLTLLYFLFKKAK